MTTPDLTPVEAEPVMIIVGGVGGLLTAAFALLVAFGVGLTQAQTASITGLWSAVVMVVTAWLSRARVTPVAKLERRDPGV